MNTDDGTEPQTTTPSDSFLLKQETHSIIGCAFEVLNEIGHGLNEKCYENELGVEFGLRQIEHSQQRQFEVLYQKQRVGLFIPDCSFARKRLGRPRGLELDADMCDTFVSSK